MGRRMRWKSRFLYLALAAVAAGYTYMVFSGLRDGYRFKGLYATSIMGPFFTVLFLTLAASPSLLDTPGTKANNTILTVAVSVGGLAGLGYLIALFLLFD